MSHTNLKQRLDGLINNFEQLPDEQGNEKVQEALEHLREAKDCLADWEGPDATSKEGQAA